MNVFVTGSQGFTGKYLTEVLRAKNYQVIESTTDVTDRVALSTELEKINVDYVVHLAALAFVAHADQEAMYKINVFGTLNLLQALRDTQQQPKKVLISSSANVYGNAGSAIIAETVCPKPINHYATSKLAMEHMVQTWFDEFPIIITRPFNYTGVGQAATYLIPKIVMHYQQRLAQLALGNVNIIRDFSDVCDIVLYYWRLLESNCQNEVINVCSGVGLSLQAILQLLSDMTQIKIPVYTDAELVRKQEINALVGDNHKLKSIIGEASPRPFSETLSWMLNAPSSSRIK